MIAVVAVLSLLASQAQSGRTTVALAAIDRGDYTTARAELSKLASAGDDTAMITMALFYHQGRGVPQDYSKAMDWYLKAFPLSNGDAYNNLGVMYRDGLGVPADRKIAYALFLIVHMRGLGGDSTQIRAGRNLDREVAEQPVQEIRAAVCYTEEYVRAHVMSRGKASSSDPDVTPSPTRRRLKDREWWSQREQGAMTFECPK
jgi:Sel1 repeat-containing protein